MLDRSRVGEEVTPNTDPDAFSDFAPQGGGEVLPSPRPVGVVKLLAGVVLPLICFAMSFPERPDWQSGAPSAYAQLLLSHKESMPLYPFLLYNMTSMVLLFASPARFRENVLVRFGIFSGVLLAAEYWLIFQAAFDPSIVWQVLLSALAAILPWGIWQFLGLFGKYRLWIVGGASVILLVSAAASRVVFPVGVFVCLWCSTPWALASYVATSFHLIRGSNARLRFSLAQLLAAVSWFAAHCSAWRISFIWMLEEYSRLPTTQPERCFVCTAVANGHPRVVHGEDYLAPNGTAYRVNDQLRVLKAFELLLASFSPKGHLACRWIYDRLGPRFAAMLIHPLLADIGYFALKPVECLALICLRLAIPGEMGLIYTIYRRHSGGLGATRSGLCPSRLASAGLPGSATGGRRRRVLPSVGGGGSTRTPVASESREATNGSGLAAGGEGKGEGGGEF